MWTSNEKDAERRSPLMSPHGDFLSISLPSLPQPLAEYAQQTLIGTAVGPLHCCSFSTDFPLSPCEAKVVSCTDTYLDFCIPSKTEKRPSFLLLGITELLNLSIKKEPYNCVTQTHSQNLNAPLPLPVRPASPGVPEQ